MGVAVCSKNSIKKDYEEEKIGNANNVVHMDEEKIRKRLREEVGRADKKKLAEIALLVFKNQPKVVKDLDILPSGCLPTDKPKWRERKNQGRDIEDASLSPPDYIKKYYGEYLDGTVGRAELNKPDVDPPLYTALYNWLRKNDMPDDLDLPTATERVEKELEHFDKEALDSMNARDFKRLARADLRRRVCI